MTAAEAEAITIADSARTQENETPNEEIYEKKLSIQMLTPLKLK